jgi:hypothetical protein
MPPKKRESLVEMARDPEPLMRDVPHQPIEPMRGEPQKQRSLIMRIVGAFAWGAHHGGTTSGI